jgi:AraC-like DNA-binding protein
MMSKRQFPPFPPWPEPAVTGLVDVTDEPIDFTPVPRQRKRRNGWTPEAQRAFIAALEECGCVSRAARAVGMSPRSVYRLLEADGADSFAEALDQAVARGVERVRDEAMLRALHGSWVPVVRRGSVVRMEFRHNDKLALGILSGRNGRSVAERRERAVSRRKYRLQLKELDREREEERRRAEAIWAEHQAVLDRIEAERANPLPMSETAPPRVRRL